MVKYPDGYVSWSPKDTFEKAYRKLDCMDFINLKDDKKQPWLDAGAFFLIEIAEQISRNNQYTK